MLPEVLVPHFTLNIPADPHANYRASKEIDNTDGEGTFALALMRATKFCDLRNRQPFYEPLGNGHEVRGVLKSFAVLMQERELLKQEHVPENAVDRALVSIKVFKSAFGAPKGNLPMPRNGDAYVGLHSVAVIGCDEHRTSTFMNSWGRDWGNKGLGTMSAQYLDEYLYDAWRQRNAQFGWARWKFERMKPTKSSEQFVRQWMIQNPCYKNRFRYRNRGHQFILYEPDSITGAYVEVIDLCNGFGLRLGWAHIFHVPRDSMGIRTSIVKEFFVWPTFRRQGYGTLLEQQIVSRAEAWGSQRIQIHIHNIDGFPHVRNVGQSFVEKCGYKMFSVELSRPTISGMAEKYLNNGRAK